MDVTRETKRDRYRPARRDQCEAYHRIARTKLSADLGIIPQQTGQALGLGETPDPERQ